MSTIRKRRERNEQLVQTSRWVRLSDQANSTSLNTLGAYASLRLELARRLLVLLLELVAQLWEAFFPIERYHSDYFTLLVAIKRWLHNQRTTPLDC